MAQADNKNLWLRDFLIMEKMKNCTETTLNITEEILAKIRALLKI